MTGIRELDVGTTNDSLTFGQLKKIVAQQRARPKEAKYAFTYADRDTLQHELEDWHDYASEDALSALLDSCGQFVRQRESSQSCERLFSNATAWGRLSTAEKKGTIQKTLESLRTTSESSPSDLESACALLSYISQGMYDLY